MIKKLSEKYEMWFEISAWDNLKGRWIYKTVKVSKYQDDSYARGVFTTHPTPTEYVALKCDMEALTKQLQGTPINWAVEIENPLFNPYSNEEERYIEQDLGEYLKKNFYHTE